MRQLPACNIKNNLIHPLEYEEKLAGSIALVPTEVIVHLPHEDTNLDVAALNFH